MASIDLSTLKWELFGWRPNHAVFTRSMETGAELRSEIGPLPARVPGSVAQALLEAGVIPDWHTGNNSRRCEWLEHRDWQFRALLPAGTAPEGERAILEAEGLDYWGWLYVDSVRVARFEGALLPHRFDLTEWLSDGKDHTLSLLFEPPPPEQGQIGWTSQSTYFKPRYNYEWDWTPRHVPIGVWQPLTLKTGVTAGMGVSDLRAQLREDNARGDLHLTVEADDAARYDVAQVGVALLDAGRQVAEAGEPPAPGGTRLELKDIPVEPWWPNGLGAQKLYTVKVSAWAKDGATLWEKEYRAGFKRVDWEPVDGLPEDARNWICVVNGKRLFMQGVNWSPVRTNYPDTTAAEYDKLIGLYKEMGCNFMRVWGGSYLEFEAFYDACDREGMLVWQGFPLSSSGIDNWPPEDPQVIARLTEIAESYIRRRGHHACVTIWCGGNELQGTLDGQKTGGGKPVDLSHPCIAAFKEVCDRLDPQRRFLETSASGPRFYAQPDDFGKGLHHHVHGPWGLAGFGWKLSEWKEYFAKDDAGFRAEVGMPGAQDVALMKTYSGELKPWPPTSEWWRHASPWWTQWEVFEKQFGDLPGEEGLPKYVEASQAQQAEALAFAADACKRRFPACAGILFWHGHDCFPCPSNNSIIDFERNPKPAFHALRKVFNRAPGPRDES